MAWNSANPVAWKRLFIEWLVIGAVVSFVSLFITKNRDASSYIAIVLGGIVYLGLGGILAKFGYQRKTLKQIRAEAAAAPPRQVGSTAGASSQRQRPAPTSRTSGGSGKSQQKRKR